MAIKRVVLGVVLGGAMLTVAAADAEELPLLIHPTIHFESDSIDVIPDDLPKLRADVTWLHQNPSAVVILEGHADHTGRADYNMELGDRRAREIKSKLLEQGIAENRMIMVVSFGELKPAVTGATHAALQQNRRVELVLR